MTLFMCKSATTPLRMKASQAAVGLLAAAGLWAAAAAVQAGDPPPANQGQTQAQTQAQTQTQAQATSNKPAKPDPEDRVTCREEETIGTRLGGHRICHTQREWKQIAQDSQDYLNSNTAHQAGPK